MPGLELVEALEYLLTRPHMALISVCCGIILPGTMHLFRCLFKWRRFCGLADFVESQPVHIVGHAIAELKRRHGQRQLEGVESDLVGIFQGYINCNHAPALIVDHNWQKLPCVYHAAQIYKERSSWIDWFDWRNSSRVSHMNLESLIDYTSQIPFELCDTDGLGCAHVFSGAAIQVDALSSTCQHLTTAHHHQHPLLLRSVEFLRLGSPVTVLGQLSLQPYMASNDLQAVLRAPCSGELAGCFIVHCGGRRAIVEALRHEAHAHLAKAASLLAGVAFVAVSVGVWSLSSRQRRRRAEGNARGLGTAPQHEAARHPASASPTLHKCLICKARARDCLLLDCAHQVCCLECARGLASPASSSSRSGVASSSFDSSLDLSLAGPSSLLVGARRPATDEEAGGMGEEEQVGGGGASGDVGGAPLHASASSASRPIRSAPEVQASVAAVAVGPRHAAQLPEGVAAQLRRLRVLIASASAGASASAPTTPQASQHAPLSGNLSVLGGALADGQAAWPACPECGARVSHVLRVYTS